MAKEGLRHSTFRLDTYKDPPCSDCSKEEKEEHVERHLREQEKRKLQQTRSMRSVSDLRALQEETAAAGVNLTQYIIPTDFESLMLLSDRKYHGDECHLVSNIPIGKHVLVITTNKVEGHHTHSLSHLIQW